MDSGQKKKVRIGGYELDAEMEKSGVRVVFGKNPDGSERWVLVKPLNSAAYEDRLNALRKQSSAVMLKNHPEIDTGYQRQAMAEKVFVGHGNWYEDGDAAFVKNDAGDFVLREGVEPIADDYDTRLGMLENRNFFLDVVSCAAPKETFQRWDHAEEGRGNSQRSSSGS